MNKTDAILKYRKLVGREGVAPSLAETQVIIEALGLSSTDVIDDVNSFSQHVDAKGRVEKVDTLRDEVQQAESTHQLLDVQVAARRLKFHLSGLRERSRSDQDFEARAQDAGRSLTLLRRQLSLAEAAEAEVADIEASAPRLFDAREQTDGGVNQ